MKEKESYRADEIAEALDVPVRKINSLIRKDQIKHIHINKTHHNCRIPKDEVKRLMYVRV